MSNIKVTTGLRPTIEKWLAGVRLYIGIGIVLASAEIWLWANEAYSGSMVTIKLQEVYAWVSLGMLALALLIGPFYKLAPAMHGKGMAHDARRLIGIGAAWFASLHAVITYSVLFSMANPMNLSNTYKSAFGLGAIALIILLAMAFTSFDRAFKVMGKWWFRLHRLVYAAVFLVLAHSFMLGAHATSLVPLVITCCVALVLMTLHVCVILQRPGRQQYWQILTVIGTIVLLGLISNYGIKQYLNKSALPLGEYTHHS